MATTKKRIIRNYNELARLNTFEDRFEYLRIAQRVADPTFDSRRYLNQAFYNSKEWKQVRNKVIIRDLGCDLGIQDRQILDRIYVHHITPLILDDIMEMNEYVLDPQYLICCSFDTHQAIHYGDENLLLKDYTARTPNDTVPWK